MTGYQETLTDPSYAGQIVLQTAPHIGNTGMNDEDPESRRIWVSGYIVRDPSRVVSNWRADESLDDALVGDGVIGISGIDTRAVTRHIRSAGSMRGGIFSGDAAALSAAGAAGDRPGRTRDVGAEPVRRGLGGRRRGHPCHRRAHRQPRGARPRRQAGDHPQPRRTRVRGARAAAGRHDRAAPRDRPGRGLLLQRTRRPRGVRRPRRASARRAR